MNRFYHYITAGLFVLVVGTTPVVVTAQSVELERQQLLAQLVTVLEAQLALLQAELADRLAESGTQSSAGFPIQDAVFFDDDTFLDDIDATVIARYRVDDMEINTPSEDHAALLDRLAELLPEAYHQNLAEFLVFRTSRDEVGAFVETVSPYQGQWRYGVNEDVFEDAIDDPNNSELIVHEFAHIFSLDEAFRASRPEDCHEFFATDSGCIAEDTVYGDFLNTFWDEALLDEVVDAREARNTSRAQTLFYLENRSDFVSRYAATSPAEDFAESFMHFVLYDDESFGAIAEEKVSFFNRFSYTRSLKAEILADL